MQYCLPPQVICDGSLETKKATICDFAKNKNYNDPHPTSIEKNWGAAHNTQQNPSFNFVISLVNDSKIPIGL